MPAVEQRTRENGLGTSLAICRHLGAAGSAPLSFGPDKNSKGACFSRLTCKLLLNHGTDRVSTCRATVQNSSYQWQINWIHLEKNFSTGVVRQQTPGEPHSPARPAETGNSTCLS
jgi:hypothetical protein